MAGVFKVVIKRFITKNIDVFNILFINLSTFLKKKKRNEKLTKKNENLWHKNIVTPKDFPNYTELSKICNCSSKMF